MAAMQDVVVKLEKHTEVESIKKEEIKQELDENSCLTSSESEKSVTQNSKRREGEEIQIQHSKETKGICSLFDNAACINDSVLKQEVLVKSEDFVMDNFNLEGNNIQMIQMKDTGDNSVGEDDEVFKEKMFVVTKPSNHIPLKEGKSHGHERTNNSGLKEKNDSSKISKPKSNRKKKMGESYTCGECLQNFNTQKQLEQHLLSQVEVGDYRCKICGKRFKNKNTVKMHIKIVHRGKKSYKCQVCGKEFGWKGDLTRHIQIHTGDTKHTCDYCGKGFIKKSVLTEHIRTHTGEKPFKCKFCSKGFIRNNQLTVHIRLHTGEKPFACEICGKTFWRSSFLTAHKRTHNHEELKTFHCETCKKGFSSKVGLTQHDWCHTGIKGHLCSLCGKDFTSAQSLRVHIRRHTHETPFECNVCGKGFVCNGDLQTHVRSHTGEKPFYCTICCKRFRQLGHLQSHKQSHESNEDKEIGESSVTSNEII